MDTGFRWFEILRLYLHLVICLFEDDVNRTSTINQKSLHKCWPDCCGYGHRVNGRRLHLVNTLAHEYYIVHHYAL